MKELKVQPIRNGTVIDHIPPGHATKVLGILGLPRSDGTSIVSAVMNVPSDALGRKDIVKVEDRELRGDEISKIALIAPDVTLNIIREFDVAQKSGVELPDTVKGVIDCTNPNCVTNHEPAEAAFDVLRADPPQLKCRYCEHVVDDVAAAVV